MRLAACTSTWLLWAVFFCEHAAHAQDHDILSRYTTTNKGWAQTTGGNGGQIIKVTTLAASGPGSLKEALSTSGKRTIVFEVGGVIDLQGQSWKIQLRRNQRGPCAAYDCLHEHRGHQDAAGRVQTVAPDEPGARNAGP